MISPDLLLRVIFISISILGIPYVFLRLLLYICKLEEKQDAQISSEQLTETKESEKALIE
jgi:hypothetical protein